MKAIIRLTMVLVASMGVSMSTIDASPIASPTTQYDGHRGSSKGGSANRGNSRRSAASSSQSSRTTNRQSTRQQVKPEKERATATKNTSRRENNRETVTTQNSGRRPTINTENRRPSGNSGNVGNNTGNRRPNNNNGNIGNRPGGKPENSGNNGNVRPNGSRPNNGNHYGHNNGNHYGHNNGHHHHNYRPVPPPHRPYRPCPHIVYRPVVPVTYVPYVNAPVLNSILGLCFGYPIYDCIDILTGRGYIIDGYNANEVYLRNIRSLGFDWDDVILYYDNGGLANISFYNSVSNYSSRRYDGVYRELCRLYGTPAISSRNGVALSASWYDGGGKNFITLSLNFEKAFGGSNRYFTSVTFGSNY